MGFLPAEQSHPCLWYICSVLELKLPEARALMLAAQGLLDPPPPAPTLTDVRTTVERLGAVQIDTISVVQRSQYLVLWSRLGAYDPTLLDRLLYPERAVFEYWGHAAAILPMADYRYHRPKMLRHREHMWSGNLEWLDKNPGVMEQTLAAIRERGPMSSAQFESTPDAKRAGTWDWYGPKASRRALEVLWWTGELMIHSRRAGQKVYDLRERVLAEAFPGGAPSDDALPTDDECRRYFAAKTLRALGVTLPSWVRDYFRLRPEGTKPKEIAALLEELVAAGHAAPARVEGIDEAAYVDTARLPDLERLRGGGTPCRTTLLSPFDSLIWHRERARMLFGYEVVFEAYVVPEKRRYGYYCLAILHRGRLVGRVDPKMERSERRLRVRGVWLEPGVVPSADLLDGLGAALADLSRFLGGESVLVDAAESPDVLAGLRERL